MQATCYFCDTELVGIGHVYKVGIREEHICEECHVKMVNRKKALENDGAGSA